MADEIKFTKEEIESINKIRNNVNNVFNQVGQVQLEKENKIKQFEELEDQLRTRYIELRNEEQNLFTQLSEKYGDGSYDPETGVFTPVEVEEDSEK